MRRLFRLSLLVVLLSFLGISSGLADQITVSGRIAPGDVRIFLKEHTYIITKDYVVGGTLIIEPGTKVLFYPNGRLIDSVGGRIIADGYAKASYNQSPNGINPIATPFTPLNPLGFSGYADLRYLLYSSGGQSTIRLQTVKDLTVDKSKYDHIFNIILDTVTRKLENLTSNQLGGNYGPNKVPISYEAAVMYEAARLATDPNDDINLNIRPWRRLNNIAVDVNFDPAKPILFKGQPENNFSLEWGHIIILPGARAAYFRNVHFDGFRKDTTVDRVALYKSLEGMQQGQTLASVNNTFRKLTNGSGGAITTFSSRTWILHCKFTMNMARYRGGAIQFLQSPDVFYRDDYIYNQLLKYDDSLSNYTHNTNLTEPDGKYSRINARNARPQIDMIDETMEEPFSDYERQAYDDGRLSVYLGRFRNNTFDKNWVQLSNTGLRQIGTPPVTVMVDLTDEPANYPHEYGNTAYGGAIYIAGKDSYEGERTQLEVGFGVNNSINTRTRGTVIFTAPYSNYPYPYDEDSFEATGNNSNNYQFSGNTHGARGGAIYLGRYTSLIVAGKFANNYTYTKYLQDSLTGANNGFYSRGGAIFTENSLGRLQVRGGPRRDAINNVTEFNGNTSGSGGAIFVDGNTDPAKSPIIGGSDATVATRDYGFNIKFQNNTAVSYGGAIFTCRNMSVNGSGGVEANSLIGYGGKYPVRFYNNKAGYAGGAIDIAVPNSAYPLIPARQRAVQMVRAEFRDNHVGMDIATRNKYFIRGGGALYVMNADLNLLKGVEFTSNIVHNGNGGAIALIHPENSIKRYFITDVDNVIYDSYGVAVGYTSNDPVLTYRSSAYPPDARMLTRFLDNEIKLDQEVLDAQSGSGTTQIGYGTKGTPNQLFGIHCIDIYNGFAVGLNGTIVKMTLGGSKWQYKNYTQPYRLTDVFFTTPNIGFIVGDRGVILKTINTGNSWKEVRPAVDNFKLNSVWFAGSLIGYTVGDRGKIFKTTDAGETWFDPTMANYTNNNLNSVYFAGTNKGFAVGDRGTIIVTANGGVTWDVKTANTFSNLKQVYFTDQDVGYAVGTQGIVIKTTNSGNTWTKIYEDPSRNFYSTYFTDVNTGYVVGEFGILLKTTDAGRTWSQLDPGTSYTFFDVFFPTTTTGFVVGDYGLIKKTTDAGASWFDIIPADISYIDVKRYHPEAALPENGVGLGGGIYLMDSVTVNRQGREDTVWFNRVRIQNNKSYTGSALYSDNFDLKLIFTRSLIANNEAFSDKGWDQNAITGAIMRDPNDQNNPKQIIANHASSDLVAATIYGEIQGPLPSNIAPWAANSIYNNKARFEIRLPDAFNTKGVLAGTTGIGYGGTDTLRGNYWGRTDADVDVVIGNRKIKAINIIRQGDSLIRDTVWFENAVQQTFFVDNHFNPKDTTYLKFMWARTPDTSKVALNQGPFESRGRFSYRAITLANKVGTENESCDTCLPDKVIMAGLVYDSYDKGTDIKTADYAQRRLSPIEDFAVGIPPILRRYNGRFDTIRPSFNKYVKRWARDPYYANLKDQNDQYVYPELQAVQEEFRPYKDGKYYHPIGYPLYLEARTNYEGLQELSNHDPRSLNESVFFIINETTGDFIRANFRQVSDIDSMRETFRTIVDLVPDSTNRLSNTTIRRTGEGLFNLGTGDFLLRNLIHTPINEDRGAVAGRKYHNNLSSFGRVSDIFINKRTRPATMPPLNYGNQTFFAGEKYKNLPVNVGDNVRIISRTVLWKEGVIKAFDEGISFKIVGSTEPPIFTGNIVKLNRDTIVKILPAENPNKKARGEMDTLRITEFLRKIFVTEDREYPATPGTYTGLPVDGGQGRDSILSVTAMDTNRFYDPRAFLYPDTYSQLTYRWSVNSNSGLARWLMVDSIPAGERVEQNPRDLAWGYIVFRGRPMNPYVVPGGEELYVAAENWPPHYRTADSLKALNVRQDIIDRFNNIFMPYLHAYKYDSTNARYLQQDTIDVGRNYTIRDTIKIFVVDSIPRFLPPNGAEEVVMRRLNRQGDQDTFIVYKPSVYTCDQTADGKLKANFAGIEATKKLRFQADFNTDDENEDEWAKSWDFRFGKTAYGFMNVNIRYGNNKTADTSVIDTTVYDGKGTGKKDQVVITQTRPAWMGNAYIYEYGSEVTQDNFARHFTTFGKLNIRIDSTTAWNLLKPSASPYAGSMITDTVFTLVANDGHAGLNFLAVPVYINYQPRIETDALPIAKEDFDYNPQLLDSSRMIRVYDPNFDQSHEFMLVYDTTGIDKIQIDPCFAEAGEWDLTNLKKTPKWLRINPLSGLLYGTPRVHDAPRTDTVTVVVWDIIDGQRQLSAIRTYYLNVEKTNHRPDITAAPFVDCIDKKTPLSDTIKVSDWDLKRTGSEKEQLTIKIVKPSGLTANPSTVNGPLDAQGIAYQKDIVISGSLAAATPDADGRVTIVVVVTDAEGVSDTLQYRKKLSDDAVFVCTLVIENSKGAVQKLDFGAAKDKVSTGDGSDGQPVGKLDYNFCEYEIPQKPPKDVFDARWSIPLTLGTHRNIFPQAIAGVKNVSTYKGIFQAGGVAGDVSEFFPVTIKWKKVKEMAKQDPANPTNASWYIRDALSNGNVFHYNMYTGDGFPAQPGYDIECKPLGTDSLIITIKRNVIDAFVILYDWASDVQESYAELSTGIMNVQPNPFDKMTNIEFGMKYAGKARIEIIDALGNVVNVPVDGDFPAGKHTVEWEARDMSGAALSSGSYTCRMIAGPVISNLRMVIVK